MKKSLLIFGLSLLSITTHAANITWGGYQFQNITEYQSGSYFGNYTTRGEKWTAFFGKGMGDVPIRAFTKGPYPNTVFEITSAKRNAFLPGHNKQKVGSQLSLKEIDCDKGRYRLLVRYSFKKTMIEGESLPNENFSKDWVSVKPDSSEETALGLGCVYYLKM